MNTLWTVFLLLISVNYTFAELRCLVCHQVVSAIVTAVENEDPKKTIEIGSFRIQPDGTQKKNEIKYAGSEIHLNDILENVCNSVEDYAQVKHKETGEMALLNLSKDIEKLSIYDIVPDPDLNRGIKFHCESFVEEYEDDILAKMNKSSFDHEEIQYSLCHTIAGYCSLTAKNHQEL